MAEQNVEQNPAQAGAADTNPNPAVTAQPGAAAAVTPGQTAGAVTPPAKQFTYTEDRTDWIPRHRLNETSGKLTKAEERALAAETALATEQKRVRALSGLDNPSPEEAETQQIKDRLYTMFPHLKALEGFSAEQLDRVFEAAEAAQGTAAASWERHAETIFADVEAEVADALGLDKLTETQIKRIRREFRDQAQEALQARPRDQRGKPVDPTRNDFLSRYERGDKTLITEFVKSFLNDWYEPARRSVTRGVVNRQSRPVPRGERTRNTPVSGPPQIDYNNEDAFKKALTEARNSGAQ